MGFCEAWERQLSPFLASELQTKYEMPGLTQLKPFPKQGEGDIWVGLLPKMRKWKSDPVGLSYLREEAQTVLITASLQEVVEFNEVSPEPPLLQTK